MNDTRCEECGALVEDDQPLCYWCAQREQAIEAQIKNMREERDEMDGYTMETLAKSMADNVRLIIEKKKLEEQMEERERKAFDWAVLDTEGWDLDACTEKKRQEIKEDLDRRWRDYRAFKEGK